MTIEDAKRHLDTGHWITRHALEGSFLTRRTAMPARLRELVDEVHDLYLIPGDGRPPVHDLEIEHEVAIPYVFNADDAGATDWELVPVVRHEWPER